MCYSAQIIAEHKKFEREFGAAMIIPIKPENLDAWLNPDAGNLAALHAILDDRDRPFYEHRMAA